MRVLQRSPVVEGGLQIEKSGRNEVVGDEQHHVPLGLPSVLCAHPLQMEEVVVEQLVASAAREVFQKYLQERKESDDIGTYNYGNQLSCRFTNY